jgi:hypothetical protein
MAIVTREFDYDVNGTIFDGAIALATIRSQACDPPSRSIMDGRAAPILRDRAMLRTRLIGTVPEKSRSAHSR